MKKTQTIKRFVNTRVFGNTYKYSSDLAKKVGGHSVQAKRLACILASRSVYRAGGRSVITRKVLVAELGDIWQNINRTLHTLEHAGIIKPGFSVSGDKVVAEVTKEASKLLRRSKFFFIVNYSELDWSERAVREAKPSEVLVWQACRHMERVRGSKDFAWFLPRAALIAHMTGLSVRTINRCLASYDKHKLFRAESVHDSGECLMTRTEMYANDEVPCLANKVGTAVVKCNLVVAVARGAKDLVKKAAAIVQAADRGIVSLTDGVRDKVASMAFELSNAAGKAVGKLSRMFGSRIRKLYGTCLGGDGSAALMPA